MTETATVVCSSSEHDILVGSSGSLVPGCKAKLLDADGREITEYEKAGELLVQSPSVVLGYLNNERVNAETFVWHDDGRWIKTGDEVLVRKAPSGHEHLVVVDRIKELIKVKVCLFFHLLSCPVYCDAMSLRLLLLHICIHYCHASAVFMLPYSRCSYHATFAQETSY